MDNAEKEQEHNLRPFDAYRLINECMGISRDAFERHDLT